MTTKFGFTKMDIQEFTAWLTSLKVARTVLTVQQHHTYIPSYSTFKGNNHFEMQKAMKDYHVNHNGWADIGQHFTSFPDGTILTGRSIERTPACITGKNADAICIEHVGNFDTGNDNMTAAHKDTIVKMTALLCAKFNRPVNDTNIVYHHWFDLSNGHRNNGTGNNKSCPGTAFFGGNKVANCVNNFLPLVSAAMGAPAAPSSNILKYVIVTSSTLNIRTQPSTSAAKVTDRPAANFGAVLRVYEEKSGWCRISGSQQHWVSGQYTTLVRRATVNADTLNVRTGPDTTFEKAGSYTKGQELFIIKEQNNWGKVSMDERWVSTDYLSFA